MKLDENVQKQIANAEHKCSCHKSDLWQGDIKVKNFQVLDDIVSDHKALIVEF